MPLALTTWNHQQLKHKNSQEEKFKNSIPITVQITVFEHLSLLDLTAIPEMSLVSVLE